MIALGRIAGLMGLATALAIAPRAMAAEPAPDVPETPHAERDLRSEVPILAYTYQASGVGAGSLGAQAYGLGAAAPHGIGDQGSQRAILGGGITFWGSPIDRLTLVGDALRDQNGNFAPSAAAIVRILGRADDGFSLGAIGKLKIEGFGIGKDGEVESEIEAGLLFSYSKYHWHLDANAIAGMGTGDDGEMDAEGRLRLGRDIAGLLRVGLDGQARYRVSGDRALVGGRSGDFTGGPQVMLSQGHYYAALTAGPTTTNVFSGLGWAAVATIGGSTL